MGKSLTFDDITLVPRQISQIKSRNNIDITTELYWINLDYMNIPIIAAPMKDVCNGNIASKMNSMGGIGIINRFMTINEQIEEFNKSNQTGGCAIGVNGDWEDRFNALYESGCSLFCIDVANGASMNVHYIIEELQKLPIDLIVGNVASKECYEWLDKLPNVKAIRVGIAGGTACTTRNATGICYGMISSIQECAAVKTKTKLIADGGIREPADMCKALAVGADMVMLGSTIANTSDSPAEIIQRDGKWLKVYHGSASFEIQQKYKDNPKYIEGNTRLLKYSGESLNSMIDRFIEGLKSSMSYFNAQNLTEYRKNVSFAYVNGV